MASLRQAAAHRPLLHGQQHPSNVLGRRPQLFLRSRTRRALLAVRSVGGGAMRREKLLEDRIREELLNAGEPSPSSYDTAWAAMVPAPGSSPQAAPRFPRCVDWILRNQRADGSWGPAGVSGEVASLGKDALSSTMACVLALRTWGVGDEHVGKGLCLIGRNSSFVTDDKCDTPAGFNVIFPGMLERGLGMGLEIPLAPGDVDNILRQRDMELKSIMGSGSKAFMAYVAEGLGSLVDWDQAMAYQRKNGSFFNSPATTAVAAIHNHNGRALEYLDSLISKFSSSEHVLPASHGGHLEKMGISPSFSSEINSILEMTYSSWLANDEEIMLDMTTCTMAFRLLRLHGYVVASEGLAQFSEETSFHESVQGHLKDTEALLELYKASQVQIMEDEAILKNIGSWSAEVLTQQLCSDKISRSVDSAEVEHVLRFPFYATLDRLEHRWNIEHFKTGGFQVLKSAYRWVKEVRLDELEFARIMPLHTLFSAASTMFPTGIFEARVAWSKMCVLTTAMDDLFDTVGSKEELENLVTLIDMWDAHEEAAGFISERVEILFRAIHHTCNQVGAMAAAVQNRSVIHHIAELRLEVATAMMAEAEWRMNSHVPSMEEYMAVSLPSFALGPIVNVSAYLVGPELPEAVVRCLEYDELFRHMSVCGRLVNDLQSYEREEEQEKVNSVLLLAANRSHGGGGGDIEAAKREVRIAIKASRRELLRLEVGEEGGAVPRPCRRLFWNMSKVVHLFYMEGDGYAFPKEMMRAANAVVLDPLAIAAAAKEDENDGL